MFQRFFTELWTRQFDGIGKYGGIAADESGVYATSRLDKT